MGGARNVEGMAGAAADRGGLRRGAGRLGRSRWSRVSGVECRGGTGLPMVVFVVFATLRLAGVTTWSWWWVTAPLWGVVVLVLLLAALGALVALVQDRWARARRSRARSAEEVSARVAVMLSQDRLDAESPRAGSRWEGRGRW